MDPSSEPNYTPMISVKLSESFIQETPHNGKADKSQDESSSKPSTFLSLLVPGDDKKGARSTKNLRRSSVHLLKQAVLNNYSQNNIRPNNQMQITELLAMTDQQMKNKYDNDGFFKAKLDLKVKKIQASHITKHHHRKEKTGDSEDDDQECERKESAKMLTLNHFKHKQQQYLVKLHEKYMRIFSPASNIKAKPKVNPK